MQSTEHTFRLESLTGMSEMVISIESPSCHFTALTYKVVLLYTFGHANSRCCRLQNELMMMKRSVLGSYQVSSRMATFKLRKKGLGA
jgi:hypothetical protein